MASVALGYGPIGPCIVILLPRTEFRWLWSACVIMMLLHSVEVASVNVDRILPLS